VISYRLWNSQFRGAEDVIGRTIRLNTRPYKIIGVSERGFTGPDLQRPSDLQIPATRLIDYMPAFVGIPHFDWQSRLSLFSAMARLKPHAIWASAAGQLTRLNRTYLKSAHLPNPSRNEQAAVDRAHLAALYLLDCLRDNRQGLLREFSLMTERGTK
jgi:hypothetical protein